MAKHNVKRIAAQPQSGSIDEWDNAWLPPVLEHIGKAARLGRDTLFASSSTLAYWGALAGIVGSILWAILFVAFQSQESGPMSDWFAFSIASWGYTKLLSVPILLFLFCLAAMFIDQEKPLVASKWLRRASFTLASLGLISLAMFTLNPYWLSLWSNNPGLFNYLNRFSGGTPLSEWVETTLPSFTLVGIGLALFGIAAIRAKALPVWALMGLVISSLAAFLVPVGLTLFLLDERDSLLYGSGILLLTLLAFGAGWAMLGYALLRGRTRDHNQEHYPSPQSIS